MERGSASGWQSLLRSRWATAAEALRVGDGRLARGAVLVLVTALAIVIARDQFHTMGAAPASAGTTEFSAARAAEHVEAVAVAPRPQGSEAAAASVDDIVRELEALGLTPEVQTTTAVRTTEGTDAIFGATVVNVMARIPGTDSSGAIVLSGHYDSGPNALGAGDCRPDQPSQSHRCQSGLVQEAHRHSTSTKRTGPVAGSIRSIDRRSSTEIRDGDRAAINELLALDDDTLARRVSGGVSAARAARARGHRPSGASA
ncbi:MAG: hypothetical protein AB7I38_03805 [Dehalococcoidia bacterium]